MLKKKCTPFSYRSKITKKKSFEACLKNDKIYFYFFYFQAAPLLNTVHVLEKEEPVETIKPPTPEKEVKKPPIDADHYYADVFEME